MASDDKELIAFVHSSDYYLPILQVLLDNRYHKVKDIALRIRKPSNHTGQYLKKLLNKNLIEHIKVAGHKTVSYKITELGRKIRNSMA